LAHELHLRGLRVERQRPVPLRYKGILLDCGYRLDLVVDGALVVEIKAVDRPRGEKSDEWSDAVAPVDAVCD
jgi:GxxExxY protein